MYYKKFIYNIFLYIILFIIIYNNISLSYSNRDYIYIEFISQKASLTDNNHRVKDRLPISLVSVYIRSLNKTHAEAIVEIQTIDPNKLKSMNIPIVITGNVENLDNISITARYIIDKRFNYAYINGTPVGFFPFYSFIELTPELVKQLKFTYLNEPLYCDVVSPDCFIYMELYGNKLKLLHLKSSIMDLFALRNYVVYIAGLFIPVKQDLYFNSESLRISPNIMDSILAVPPYKDEPDTDWMDVLIPSVLVVALALIVYKRRR